MCPGSPALGSDVYKIGLGNWYKTCYRIGTENLYTTSAPERRSRPKLIAIPIVDDSRLAFRGSGGVYLGASKFRAIPAKITYENNENKKTGAPPELVRNMCISI